MENETERKLKEAVRLLARAQRALFWHGATADFIDEKVSSAPLWVAIQSWIANNELQLLLKD